MELQDTGPTISGTLRIMDWDYGAAEYSVKGTFDDKLKLAGDPVRSPPDVELGVFTAEAVLTPEGSLRGTWTTTIGTGGPFEIFPHRGMHQENLVGKGSGIPEQLYTKNIPLGSVRLFAPDVKQLLIYIRQDFASGRPVVTFNIRGSQVTKFSEDFLSEADSLGQLEYLKVTIQEPEPEGNGINRLIVVELNAFGNNEVRGQGMHESWVIGKTEATAALLKRHERVVVTKYKKFGLGLNQIIFMGMLIVMPDIENWRDRTLFVIAVFFLLACLYQVHARFIPNASVQMSISDPSFWEKMSLTVRSWAAAIATSLVAAWIYSLLSS
ncbi:hypothetical protein [Nitrosospira multiformis]|uniref:hypothetical protein n=1 Tax=Nitrosospira multiformis TaxID=1231 RepID=UPI00115FE170|nr:hypothetical protein [Nitrosospira multiformis]